MKVSKTVILTALFALVLLGAVKPAMATTVIYTAGGTFTAGTLNVLPGTPGGSLTFNGQSAGSGGPFPTALTLGTFQSTLGVGDTVSGTGSFMLSVTQLMPTGLGGTTATLMGSISDPSNPSGTIYLVFGKTSFLINGVDYSLINLQCGEPAVTCPVNTTPDILAVGPGSTTLKADISLTPEPAFYGLTGIGLAGLISMAIRKKRQECRGSQIVTQIEAATEGERI